MKVENIDVDETLRVVRQHLEQAPELSPGLRSALEMLMLLVTILIHRLKLDSQNSHKPPASDKHPRAPRRKGRSGRKPGKQNGHPGATLTHVDDPDERIDLRIDRRTLPKGRRYRPIDWEVRQVFDLDISCVVTEYRAEVFLDDRGERHVAQFPEGVTAPVQYGVDVKGHDVYMPQYQLIPFDRVRDHFQEQLGIPVSAGSVFNFNQEAYERLAAFEDWAKRQLAQTPVLRVDETGIRIAGKQFWLHCASNPKVTWLAAHAKRGSEAMIDIGVLPVFEAILCHDHWKPYLNLTAVHALCNAHHLRELERAWEQDGQAWAWKLKAPLLDLHESVAAAGGQLPHDPAQTWRARYRAVLKQGDVECPPPPERRPGQRGRPKRSKSRNLLERLIQFEDETLLRMERAEVPFSNNQAESHVRINKVQQKISGSFHYLDGAHMFCRIRSYLSTCRKNGVSATEALRLLFLGKSPSFMAD